MVCALTKVITDVFFGWGKRQWRTWLGLYLDKKNSFSSESSRRQNERCLIAGGCFVPSSSGEL